VQDKGKRKKEKKTSLCKAGKGKRHCFVIRVRSKIFFLKWIAIQKKGLYISAA
jgi:hypothetical protein